MNSVDTNGTRSPNDYSSCSLTRGAATLDLSEDRNGQYQAVLGQIEGDLTLVTPPSLTFYGVTAKRDAGSIMLEGKCSGFMFGDCGHAFDSLNVVIDERTGVVTSFTYFFQDQLIQAELFENDFAATGWPRCAATDAAPPSWIPDANPPLGGNCLRPVGIGCVETWDYTLEPTYPTCNTATGCNAGQVKTIAPGPNGNGCYTTCCPQ